MCSSDDERSCVLPHCMAGDGVVLGESCTVITTVGDTRLQHWEELEMKS